MSNYCNCCINDAEWVKSHLNWEIDATDADWEREASECLSCWGSEGMPDVAELAGLLRRVYA